MANEEEIERWKKRFERERKARKEAENLLEKKALDLYKATEELHSLNAGLDKIIQKRTEMLLKQKEQTELILSNIVSPMLITSKRTRKIIYANPEASAQYRTSLNELIGSSIERIYVDQNDAFKIRDALKACDNALYGMELRFKAFDDHEFDALLSLVEIDFYGEPAFLGMVTDITKQKQREEELSRLHRDMKSSIEYASLIQKSLLSNQDILNKRFKDYFIIWEPRDIVGGDIYFIEDIEEMNTIFLMLIDCTGHGVPGAFLTMLIKAIHRQIVDQIKKNNYLSPSMILQMFNSKLRETLLNQSGFDGAVLFIDYKNHVLNYSGAKLNLYFIRNGKIDMFKGDRFSIGYNRTALDYKFNEISINLESNDKIYLTTDGFTDQMGGEKYLPFGSKNFYNLIIDQQKNSMEIQKMLFLILLRNIAVL